MKRLGTVRAALFLLTLCAVGGINALFGAKADAWYVHVAWIAYVIVAGGLVWTHRDTGN